MALLSDSNRGQLVDLPGWERAAEAITIGVRPRDFRRLGEVRLQPGRSRPSDGATIPIWRFPGDGEVTISTTPRAGLTAADFELAARSTRWVGCEAQEAAAAGARSAPTVDYADSEETP